MLEWRASNIYATVQGTKCTCTQVVEAPVAAEVLNRLAVNQGMIYRNAVKVNNKTMRTICAST